MQNGERLVGRFLEMRAPDGKLRYSLVTEEAEKGFPGPDGQPSWMIAYLSPSGQRNVSTTGAVRRLAASGRLVVR